jgi:hypothetical protein
MLPLGALAILWAGLSPVNELRAVYLSDGLGFNPHALSLYLALPGLYLAPLVAVVCATAPFRSRYLAAACIATSVVLLFPVAASPTQLREGASTVGFVHRAAVTLLPAFAQTWPFLAGTFVGWYAVSAAATTLPRVTSTVSSLHRQLLIAIVASFLVVMPFSYMPWEKYGLPLLMAVVPLLGAGLVRRTPPPDPLARTGDETHIVGSVLG